MTITRGQRYRSKVWLDGSTNEPLVVRITKVTPHTIYYRPDYGVHDDGTPWLGAPRTIRHDDSDIAKYLGERVE